MFVLSVLILVKL